MVFWKIVSWGYAAIAGGGGGQGVDCCRSEQLPFAGASMFCQASLETYAGGCADLFNIMCIMRLCISCSLSGGNCLSGMSGHQAALSSLCGSLRSSTACVASMILARSIASGLIRQPLANASVKKSLVKHSNSSLNSNKSSSACVL